MGGKKEEKEMGSERMFIYQMAYDPVFEIRDKERHKNNYQVIFDDLIV